ncbi:uncharacterized protein LAESUDRAFT_729141 [Laetiporus sulphureus 93-53]|uniref:Large ribosomal subunit protein mL46 n=1 Tax=Laetiporus sulphureus 93-53 TaxID=1314785 RepID=A0A165CW65_9APHY|nr:uncharacterized protein LAESUDRAFT_729141 [Laetiporus sulphureus 93-53]KZT03558.1 hypothetical protein LAESUDRAFT_729141 [Laetiporus sulphureus 93-53]
MWARNAWSSCGRHSRVRCAHVRPRTFATVADAPSSSSTSSSSQNDPSPIINAAVILNRSPLITRTPSNFERAYYAYHARIRRALFNPFPDEFYFKKGSLLEDRFALEEKERERVAFGSTHSAQLKDSSAEADLEAAPAFSETVIKDSKEERPMPRTHEADIKGDVQSLDRKGERNIYLLLQGQNAAGKTVWRFPQGELLVGELLHEAASRELHDECGPNMDTWVVSQNPIGVYQPSNTSSPSQTYVFFYKAHILAGQAIPNGKNVLNFAWLTKEEIEPRVDQDYWSGIRDMLSDF